MGASQTISGAGCTSTAVAMAIKKSGVKTGLSNFNPATFVDWMNKHDGYEGNLFKWNKPTELAPAFQYKGKTDLSGKSNSQIAAIMKKALENGEYIIASVGGGSHWVFVDYIKNGEVYILDPGCWPGYSTLFNYTNINEFASYVVVK